MPKFEIHVPVTAVAVVVVEAASKDEAISDALSDEVTILDLQQLQAHRHITVRGQFQGRQHSVTAEPLA